MPAMVHALAIINFFFFVTYYVTSYSYYLSGLHDILQQQGPSFNHYLFRSGAISTAQEHIHHSVPLVADLSQVNHKSSKPKLSNPHC